LLGLLLADAGLSIGAAGKNRLRESMGRLGLSLTKDRSETRGLEISDDAVPVPRIAQITIDLARGSITFALPT
jgi:hypothetical protein